MGGKRAGARGVNSPQSRANVKWLRVPWGWPIFAAAALPSLPTTSESEAWQCASSADPANSTLPFARSIIAMSARTSLLAQFCSSRCLWAGENALSSCPALIPMAAGRCDSVAIKASGASGTKRYPCAMSAVSTALCILISSVDGRASGTDGDHIIIRSAPVPGPLERIRVSTGPAHAARLERAPKEARIAARMAYLNRKPQPGPFKP